MARQIVILLIAFDFVFASHVASDEKQVARQLELKQYHRARAAFADFISSLPDSELFPAAFKSPFSRAPFLREVVTEEQMRWYRFRGQSSLLF